MDEVINDLNKRSQKLMPPNMKQALDHLILTDCSYSQFLSKQELAYKVMDLSEIRKSFNAVSVVGFYARANLIEQTHAAAVEYSDRTNYSAYAVQCEKETKTCPESLKKTLRNMYLREFAETINHTWVKDKKKSEAVPIDPNSTQKFKNRVKGACHWVLSKRANRRHIRWNTVLYCELCTEL